MTALQAWGQLNAGRDPPAAAVFPERGLDGGRLGVEGGVPVMHLHGSAAAMGRQHGLLQAGNVHALKRLYIDRVFPTPALRETAIQLSLRMLDYAPPEYGDEVESLGRSSGVGFHDALLIQTFPDVMRGVACSTFTVEAEATAEGVPLFGRNLDFPGFGIAHRYNMMTVFHPSQPGRKVFAAFTWPGMMGPLTGMNCDGLAIATMQVISDWERLEAMPYPFLYREVLSQCSTVAEAEEYLLSARIGTTNNLMMMDAEGRTSVAELNHNGVHVRRPQAGGLFSTNHFNAKPHYQAIRCDRYDNLARRWERDRGRMTIERMRSALHAVSQGWLTLQSMVMMPSERRAEFAFGLPPSTRQPFHPIDLAEHFRRRPAAMALPTRGAA